MRLNRRIAFIGAGNMTEALVAGLLKAEVSQPAELNVTDILPERRVHMETRYGVRSSEHNAEGAAWGSILILSIEPQHLDDLLHRVRPAVQTDTLIISVAAGYPIARLNDRLNSRSRIVRAMPNTPSTVLEGMTALAFGPEISQEDRQASSVIFESVGKVVAVDESLMDAVTGLSGSGPAYVYLMIEALADGGVKMGLTRPVAELLAIQTTLGSARMLMESGEHPARLKDRVASPGGTTIAGIHRLEEGRFRAAFISAVEAATICSRKLGMPA